MSIMYMCALGHFEGKEEKIYSIFKNVLTYTGSCMRFNKSVMWLILRGPSVLLIFKLIVIGNTDI